MNNLIQNTFSKLTNYLWYLNSFIMKKIVTQFTNPPPLNVLPQNAILNPFGIQLIWLLNYSQIKSLPFTWRNFNYALENRFRMNFPILNFQSHFDSEIDVNSDYNIQRDDVDKLLLIHRKIPFGSV